MRKRRMYLEKWQKTFKRVITLLSFLFIGLLLGINCDRYIYAQHCGLKYSRNYSSKDYVIQPQNWCILQDQRGVIYAANGGGILEYNGASWNPITIPNLTARSLAVDETGTIYVGGIDEIGFLAPDAQGRLKYESLLDYIGKDKRNFGWVWRTHAAESGVYFRTSKYLFCWYPGQKQMKIWQPRKGQRFNASFACEREYFINQSSIGLMQIEKNSLKIIPGGEILASIKTPFMMAPLDSPGKGYLIGTREKGFFIFDGKGIKPYALEIADYLPEKKVCHGIRLSGGDLAMATLRGGLLVTDIQGRLKYQFTKDTGLLDNNVKYVFEDFQGNIWAALNKGIVKIEYSSPLSVFDDHSNLPGMVLSVVRHVDGLYAGTSEGLFFLGKDSSMFTPVPGITSMCWSLLSAGDSVLAATDIGVFQIHSHLPRQVTRVPTYVLQRSGKYPGRIWAGTQDTLISLYKKNNQGEKKWEEEYRYKNTKREVRTIEEDRGGSLWLGLRTPGVIRVDFPGNDPSQDHRVTHYENSSHIPEGSVQVFSAAGHVMFGADAGLFRFDEAKNIFVKDITLGKDFTSTLTDVYRLKEGSKKSIWLHATGRNYRAILKQDGTYRLEKKPLARIPVNAQVNAIYPDTLEKAVWFASNEGLIRFDTGIKKEYSHQYPAIIQRVLVNGTPRFYDFFIKSAPSIPIFPYEDRNLRFEFAAPFFEDENRVTYSCMLQGYDNEWLNLPRENFKDYTNLGDGSYSFRVKARNVYDTTSGEAVFRFKILPPWYRTWWAYICYGLLFIFTIFFIVRWRSNQLKKEKKRLEQIVNQRTKEIDQKNQQLQKQTILLQEQAEKLTELDHAKSRFFANISHEFRTPLTLIIGPLERLLSARLPEDLKEKLTMMQQNSLRLLALINQLLDLSRIDSGKMKLRAAAQDIVSFLKGILASFEHLAGQNEVEIEFFATDGPITLYFDAEKLEQVFNNLLSNAVKFNQPGGKISLKVRQILDKEEDFPSGCVEVVVKDTGIGIAKEQLAHIFERFYQVDSKKQKYKGSGIGLALTRELVLLHHGKIDVSSRVGEESGSEFLLRFPLGKDHLKPGEIAHREGIVLPAQAEEERDEGMHLASEFDKQVAEDRKAAARDSESPTVLVVEDNHDMRRFISEAIESHYTVAEAVDGKEGIKKAQEIMPDLVISDIMMPEKDGYELCQKLKTDIETSHIPVILLTAKASEESMIQGLKTGADDYITKPFNERVLLNRIKNLIDLRRQLQEKFQRQMVLLPAEIEISSMDQRFLEKLQALLEKEISDSGLNVEALSRKMGISRVTLNKKILALTGETATEFIRTFRLKRAVQLLEQNFGTILDVALEVGFESPSYFARCFKEKFQQSPSAFLSKQSQ